MLKEITAVIESFAKLSEREQVQIIAVGMAVVACLKTETLEQTQEYIKELHEAANF